MAETIRQDLDAPYWSIEQAARHFGITRGAVRRYIRDGLPTYFLGTMVKPTEFIAERIARRNRQHAGKRNDKT